MEARGTKKVTKIAFYLIYFLCKKPSNLILQTIKFSFSEKSTKIWKDLVLTLLSKNSCFVKLIGRFFPKLWLSHNVLTLQYSHCMIEWQQILVSKNNYEIIHGWLNMTVATKTLFSFYQSYTIWCMYDFSLVFLTFVGIGKICFLINWPL